MEREVKSYRTSIIIYFIAGLAAFILAVYLPSSPALDVIGMLVEIAWFAFSIVVLVYSIKAINSKDSAFGIVFLVLSIMSILLFLLIELIAFLIGFMDGWSETPISGNIIRYFNN